MQPTTTLAALAACLLCANAQAQTQPTPENAPPWWGVQDNFTVSLHWDFNNGGGPLPPPVPNFQSAAPWYSNQSPWSATGAPLQFLPQFQGHTGVYALVGNGTQQLASLDLFVDNDPHLNWVKTFQIQYEEYDTSGDGLTGSILQQLSQYGRATVTEKRAPLASGWNQVTIQASLIPQPDDEEFEWTFETSGSDTVAIDNLYVSTRCVKPVPDEKGGALGKVTAGTNQSVNLTVLAGGRTCRCAAVTMPSGGSNSRRVWVGAVSATGQAHELLEIDPAGQTVVGAIPLLTSPTQAPGGPMDLTVGTELLPTGNVAGEYVYALLAAANGDLVVEAFDVQNNAFDPARTVVIPANVAPFLPNQPLGLAYNPDGDGGNGSYWITGQIGPPANNWRAFEYPVATAAQGSVSSMPMPPQTTGLAYDETLGNFYSFSRDLVPRPNGLPSRVNGNEISGYSRLPTGVRFCGDLRIPNPGGTPGGAAAGMSMYRTFGGVTSEARFACVASLGGEQYYYELAGPYRYGYSRYGTLGMQSGPPFVGGSFDVTLSGVPNSLLAALFLGNSDNNLPIGVEAFSSVNSFTSIGPILPIAPGEFAFTIQVPATPALNYFELFAQCVVLDGTAPGFLGFTQAGKTVIYP
jgi:hypothetical protein